MAIQELTPRLSQILGIESSDLKFLDIETIDRIRESNPIIDTTKSYNITQENVRMLIEEYKLNFIFTIKTYVYLSNFEDILLILNSNDILDRLITLADDFEFIILLSEDRNLKLLIDENDDLYDIEVGEF